MALKRIEVEIDEIVLHGLPAVAPDGFATELRNQLARMLIAERLDGPTSRSDGRAPVSVMRLAHGATMKQVSARLARVIAAEVAGHADVEAALLGAVSPRGKT